MTAFPAIAATGMIPLVLFPNFGTALCLAVLQGALVVPLIPISDAVCMERCVQFGWGYGRLRLWGTVGFLITSSCGGFVAERFGWTTVMLIMIIFTYFLALGGYFLKASHAPLLKDTKDSIQNLTKKLPSTNKWVLKNPVVLFFLAATICHQMAFGAYNLFYGIQIESITGNPEWISIGWSIATVSEIAFFSQADRIIKNIGPMKLMGLAILSGIVRWTGMSVTTSLPLAMGLQLLHGIMLGGFTTGAVAFAHNLFPKDQKTFGQGLHNAAYNGLGGILAAQFAGLAFSYLGASKMFLIAANISFASFIMLALGPGELVQSLRRIKIKIYKSKSIGKIRKRAWGIGGWFWGGGGGLGPFV